MAISRVPGYSLLANLDRQGTDLYISSTGQTLQYWDVAGFKVGINTSTPTEELDVSGNVITSGDIYAAANSSYSLGTNNSWWGTAYATSVQSVNVTGTLLTNTQPNITELGLLSNLAVFGNTTLTGNVVVNGNILVAGNITANNVNVGNLYGNITGYILSSDQPFITNLGDITVSNISITGGNLVISGNINLDTVNADLFNQNGNIVLDVGSNIIVAGDVFGYGTNSNVQLNLTTTGVTPGIYGSNYQTGQFAVDAAGRIISAANIEISQIGNLLFNDTSLSSNTDITIQTLNSGNIYLIAANTGIVKINGNDAVGIPSGGDVDRPLNPEIGYTRFNTDRNALEIWDGGFWTSPGLSTVSSQIINPDGVANTFVLTSNATTDGVLVSINGTLQQPAYSYNIFNNNQIQFTEIPLTSDKVEIRYISGGIVSVGSLSFGTLTAVNLDAANVNVTGNIIPSSNVTYSLGSSSRQWKDLWVSGNTVYIGGAALTVTNGTLNINGNSVIANLEAYGGNISANNVTISGNLTVTNQLLQIDNVNQLVGIGYDGTSPEFKLYVSSEDANVKGIMSYSTHDLGSGIITTWIDTNETTHFLNGNVSFGGIMFAASRGGDFHIGKKLAGGYYVGTKEYFQIRNGNMSEHFTMDWEGNVGLGNTTPQHKLVVSGTTNITGNLTASNIQATNLTGTLLTAAQPNITSLGTLTSLSASGTIVANSVIASFTSVTASNTATGRSSLGVDAGGSLTLGFQSNSGVATTPYIDFHSSATFVDFDARIMCTGNTGVAGTGTLIFTAGNVIMTNPTVSTSNLQISTLANVTSTTPSTSTTTGALLVAGGVGIAGNLNVGEVGITGRLFVGSLTDVETILERANISATSATGTVNADILDNAIMLFTSNAAANWTYNVRGNATTRFDTVVSTNQSVSLAFLPTIGATGFYQTNFQIDGANVTVKWQGNAPPSISTLNSIQLYTYTILKRAANTYTVLGSVISYV